MRHLPSDKYNVAWFKLAEFVVRGEKERALGMYRLLVHSFDDKALARQLAGDLLLSFKDVAGALLCYQEAAGIYQDGKRLIEAAAVYEHIGTLAPDDYESMYQLLLLYTTLKNEARFGACIQRFCKLLVQKNEINKIEQLIYEFPDMVVGQIKADIYRTITLYAIQQNFDEQQILQYLTQTFDILLQSNVDYHCIQSFLASLHILDAHYYARALEYIHYEDEIRE